MTFTTTYSNRFLFLFAPYVCLILLSCSTCALVVFVGASSTSSSSTQQQQQQQRNMTQCRQQQGFDPQHLACSTCDLLPQKHQTDCRKCCQTYKDVATSSSLLRRPYQAAVLIHYESRGVTSPVDELLQDKAAWDKFVTEELEGGGGGEQRLQVLKRDPMQSMLPNEMMDIMGAVLSMQRATAGEVLFFDDRKILSDTNGKITYEKAEKFAKERISLRDLSQDDIRDMLKTLLPPPSAAAQQEKESKASSSSLWSFF